MTSEIVTKASFLADKYGVEFSQDMTFKEFMSKMSAKIKSS